MSGAATDDPQARLAEVERTIAALETEHSQVTLWTEADSARHARLQLLYHERDGLRMARAGAT